MVQFEGRASTGIRAAVQKIVLLLSVAFAASGSMIAATTHYIAANGVDSNDGTSEGAPWAHLPGMASCTANCASYTPAAGDQFILRGGDTWANASFPIAWTWSGSSGSPIYIGVDKTWYSGSTWNRPVFNAGGTEINGGTANNFIKLTNVTYVTVDNIEMTGMYWTGAGSYGNLGAISTYDVDYLTLDNLYIHNWTHATGGGTTDSNMYNILGQTTSPFCEHCLLENSVIQDADGGADSGSATYAWGGSVINCIFHDLPNAIFEEDAGSAQISGNLIYNITTSFAGTHENAIESLGGATGALYIFNNVIHDITAESLMLGNTNETDYVWNNVFYNLSGSNPPSFPQTSGQTGMSLYYWNNTVVTNTADDCFHWVSAFGGTYNTVAIQNNHCITTGSLYTTGFSPTTTMIANNVLQTPTMAAGQGYSAGETYAYSPTLGTNSTIGAGKELCGVEETCTGNFAALAEDTSYACKIGTGNAVACPTRTAVVRSAMQDAGAYQYLSLPSPTGLKAVAH